MTLSSVAIKRPVFTVMITVAMVVLGLVGFTRLGSDLFPDAQAGTPGLRLAWPVCGVSVGSRNLARMATRGSTASRTST